jgi:predicted nucleic acid-binding protein
MQKTIISDTSCLILLDKIGELDLLHGLFKTLIITPEIASEFGKGLPDWFKLEICQNKTYQLILEASLDRGEASAIALGLEKSNPLLIMDDLKGRKFAEKVGLKVTGSLGVLILAKNRNLIPSVKPIIQKIRLTDFRLTKSLENKILQLSGENPE